MRGLRGVLTALVAVALLWSPVDAARVDLLTGLISYWDMDDSGDPGDDVHGSNNLTEFNGVDTVSGKISNASDFEVNEVDYLYLADNADLSFGNEDFTLAAWVNLENISGGVALAIMSKGTAGGTTGEYYFQWSSSTTYFQFQTVGGAGYTDVVTVNASNFGTPSTATWYYVVAWMDAANDLSGINVCAGGSFGTANTTANTTGAHDAAGVFAIGSGYPHAGTIMDGLIDEGALWSRTLTSPEKTDLCAAGTGLAYPLTSGGGGPIPAIINNPIRGGGTAAFEMSRLLKSFSIKSQLRRKR